MRVGGDGPQPVRAGAERLATELAVPVEGIRANLVGVLERPGGLEERAALAGRSLLGHDALAALLDAALAAQDRERRGRLPGVDVGDRRALPALEGRRLDLQAGQVRRWDRRRRRRLECADVAPSALDPGLEALVDRQDRAAGVRTWPRAP